MFSKNPSHIHKRGQSLVFIALGMAVFLGFVALAIDGGHILSVRRRARAAADEAALAAANAWARDNSNWQTAALNVAKNDGFDNDADNVEVDVQQLDSATCQELTSDTASAQCSCFQVSLKAQTTAIFAQFIGQDTSTTGATAISHACKEVPLEDGYAIRSRDDLKVKNGGGAMAWGRVRSDSNIIRTEMGHLWSFQGFPFPFGGEITAGESIECNGGFMFCNPMMNMMAIGPQVPIMGAAVYENTPRPPMTALANLPKPEACNTVAQPISCSEITGVDAMEAEMAAMMSDFMNAASGMPNISNFSGFTGSDSASEMFNSFQGVMEGMFNDFREGTDEACKVYPPGQYNTAIRVNDGEAAIFLPGAHCFAQDVTIDGHAMGLNQTFYFENGSSITLGNRSTVALDAGTPPFDWGGMLFYNPGHVTISTESGSMLVGSIYAPNGNCDLNGGGMMMGWSQLLCNQITIRGGFQVMIAFDADHVYHVPARVDLVK